MIAVIDYGAGNLQSVEKALRHIGCACEITADPECLLSADAVLAASLFHFKEITIPELKEYLAGRGIPVRR